MGVDVPAFKILLAGHWSSGRSSFFMRYFDNLFERDRTTIAAPFKVATRSIKRDKNDKGDSKRDRADRKVNNSDDDDSNNNDDDDDDDVVDVKVQMWDTASRERFYSVAPAYYRGSQGVVFFVDILNRKSLDVLVNDIKPAADTNCPPGVRYILVGTKADRASERVIPKHELEELAKCWGTAYHEETS
eukprot:TRINITY_DN3814_c3_g1_i3.p1 TRINITY_DN3814_c3_g1~~TRINITY_DN3814_c3_g1_i3.p1  ORF type:complete len:188 (-),score=45.71 TRINITY_DN3814_c3_g1_i3:157-720(-)